jgi:hypothetical protein
MIELLAPATCIHHKQAEATSAGRGYILTLSDHPPLVTRAPGIRKLVLQINGGNFVWSQIQKHWSRVSIEKYLPSIWHQHNFPGKGTWNTLNQESVAGLYTHPVHLVSHRCSISIVNIPIFLFWTDGISSSFIIVLVSNRFAHYFLQRFLFSFFFATARGCNAEEWKVANPPLSFVCCSTGLPC